MRTTDGVEITHGLRVWTNNVRAAVVDLRHTEPLQENGEWWFSVREDGHGHVLQSETRVAVRWRGNYAHPDRRWFEPTGDAGRAWWPLSTEWGADVCSWCSEAWPNIARVPYPHWAWHELDVDEWRPVHEHCLVERARRDDVESALAGLSRTAVAFTEHDRALQLLLDAQDETGQAPPHEVYYRRDDAGVQIARLAVDLVALIRADAHYEVPDQP